MKTVCKLIRRGFVAALLLTLPSALCVPPPNGVAPVDPPPYGFAIDGDLMANTPAAEGNSRVGAAVDWHVP